MRLKEEGKIRAAGVSNFDLEDLLQAQSAGHVDALQSQYNMFQREVEKELLPTCEKHGITFVPWGPLAYGLLGGRYGPDFRLSKNDWRHRAGLFDSGEFEKKLETVENLKAISNGRVIPISHIATAWLLSHPAVGSVIAGAKKASQVIENAKASEFELTEEQIARIALLLY